MNWNKGYEKYLERIKGTEKENKPMNMSEYKRTAIKMYVGIACFIIGIVGVIYTC